MKHPGGCAQSPLSSAFPIIILLGNSLRLALVVGLALQTADRRYQDEGAVRDIIQEHVSWLHLCGVHKNLYPSAPANNLHRLEDYAHRQCVYGYLTTTGRY